MNVRKPHALATSAVHPSHAWSVGGFFSSSPAAPRAPQVSLTSYTFLHVAHTESGEADLASRLFSFLQLRLFNSLLHTSSDNLMMSSTGTARIASSSSMKSECRIQVENEAPFVLLRHLRGEVHKIGDMLLAHYNSQHRVLSKDDNKEGEMRTLGRQKPSHRINSGSQRKKEGRVPVQLIPVLSDTEQALLRPLQLHVAEQIIGQLSGIERLYQSVLSQARTKAKRTSKVNVHSASTPSSPLQTAKNQGSDADVVGEHIGAEVRLFYQDCTRVAAVLVALQGTLESDVWSLACLAHILHTSAAAGAPVSVAMLIDAVARVRQEDEHVHNGAHTASDGEGSSANTLSSSEAASTWRSCVPWLLHRYAATHLFENDTSTPKVDWPVASAWMTSAADRVCATQSAELLHLSSSTSRGSLPKSKGLFGPWQRVLDQEDDGTLASGDDVRGSRIANAAPSIPTADAELHMWIAQGHSQQQRKQKENLQEGSLQPYWAAVMREVRNGGAQAVDVLLSIACVSVSAEYMQRKKSVNSALKTNTKSHEYRQHNSTHYQSIGTLIKDLQFHAMGSYVSLRRIMSSLQRHRRLVPLLQLHALISGYRPGEHAMAQEERNGTLGIFQANASELKDTVQTDSSKQCRGSASLENGEYAIAQQQRQRLLTGELMGVELKDFQTPRRHHHNSNNHSVSISTTLYQQLVHQTGAMLWREVALFDAYTLITLGHVSEHAVDVMLLEKRLVLQQLSWLQRECVEHLRTLEGTPQKRDNSTSAEAAATAGCGSETDNGLKATPNSSYRLSRARTRMLLNSLTPRTRATLIAKLQEGLRLSVKVLARWGEAEQICCLYQSHPAMGASWEIGRALLQRGHYDAAVTVLRTLLESSGGVGQSAPSSVASLRSSSAVAVRQLLLEALQGAASALVAEHRSEQRRTRKAASLTSSSTLNSPPDISLDAHRIEHETKEVVTSFTTADEKEVEAPLPASLRAQLHSLYVHTTSLPVSLPLCLHAVIKGLTDVPTTATVAVVESDNKASSWWRTGSSGTLQQGLAGLHATTSEPAVPPDEQLRRTAVLCTYILRCHLAEQPSSGLLSKTVELWALSVARYFCRCGGRTATVVHNSACLGSLRLSTTDRYLREVTVRVLYGYPHVPVARLLLTRLLQQWTLLSSSSASLLSAAHAFAYNDQRNHSRGDGRDARAAAALEWLLRHLFRFAEFKCEGHDQQQKAYPVCTPDAVIEAGTNRKVSTMLWNADFTERYTQDTLRLMPRIALDNLVHFLNVHGNNDLQYILDRVHVARRCRASEDDTLHQPWQCTTCHLWNGRYTNECKRCHTLATSLLQCRTCGFFTSSAGYRATHGLSCEVCGAVLVAQEHRDEDIVHETTSSFALPWSSPVIDTRRSGLLASTSENSRENLLSNAQRESSSTFPSSPSETTSSAGAATVTGSGRPSSLFRDAPNVLRVVSLRPWTCTHCRAENDAQHIFFCRSCGRLPTTEAMTCVAAVDEDTTPCGCCGNVAKTVESRLSPWCERCGSLHKRLQSLFTSSSTSSRPLQQQENKTQAYSCHSLRSPMLWWCPECAVTLNPWTRTHCSLCGGGRPAAATALNSVEQVLKNTDNASSMNVLTCQWQFNSAAPFITVPWSMQPCSGCQSPNRVGAHFCWKCGSPQTWPASVKNAVIREWQHWLTQVTHTVTLAAKAESIVDCKEAKEEKQQRDVHPGTLRTDAGLGVPLLFLRGERWVCLRDGCLHVNVTSGADVTEDALPRLSSTPVCCAVCRAPRRHVEVFNPFRDRLCWRKEKLSRVDKNASALPASIIVEALLLPKSAPYPTEKLVVTLSAPAADPSVSTVSSESTATHPVRVVRHVRDASIIALTACACCGAVVTDGKQSSEGLASTALEQLSQPIRVRPLFLVTVCQRCGHCSWGRSCGAYVPSVQVFQQSLCTTPCSLLPGEEALALRLLLRSLTLSVQQAVALEIKKREKTNTLGEDGKGSAMQTNSNTNVTPSLKTAFTQKLDWAWFSRHVLSAVQLIHNGSFTAASEAVSTKTQRCLDEKSLSERLRLRDTLLPWRGCDVATAQQLCTAEQCVAALSDTAGTAHSALIDVREVLEGICCLVELRVGEIHCISHGSRQPRNGSEQGIKHNAPSSPPPPAPQLLPVCLQDAWTRRLLCAALDLVDVVNRSTVCDEIGFATLRRLCLLLRPHELDHVDTEMKWCYLREMKLTRTTILHGCVLCERCLTRHTPERPCSAL